MHQVDFWKSNFGDGYIQRNSSKQLLSSNIVFFSNILQKSQIKPNSILELGANIGLNAQALRAFLPDSKISGVEVNKEAFLELSQVTDEAFNSSIEDFHSSNSYDFVFTKGVLIHIAPDSITNVYKSMALLSSRYVMFAEYFSRQATNITYRGHDDVLYKRDFLNEFLEANQETEWKLIDYGFASRFDCFPQDDLNWYLLEKV